MTQGWGITPVLWAFLIDGERARWEALCLGAPPQRSGVGERQSSKGRGGGVVARRSGRDAR